MSCARAVRSLLLGFGCPFAERFSRRIVEDLAQPPIHYQDFPKWANHHILGLEIAMDDSTRVSKCDRLGDAQQQAQAISEDGNLRNKVVEAQALYVLHAVEDPAIRQCPGIVNRDDSRMLQPSQNVRLA